MNERGVPQSRAIERELIVRLIVANGIAGIAVTTYLVLAAELPPGTTRLENLVTTAISFVLGLALLSGIAIRRALRVVRPAIAWIDTNRAPTPDERTFVLGLPRRLALFQVPFWLTAAVVTAGAQQLFAVDPKPFFTVTGILQGALFGVAIGFLLSERSLRPFMAVALAEEIDPPRGRVSIGARLLLAWLIGSGIPVLGIVATPLVASDADLGVTVPMVFLAATAFIGGSLLILVAAKSITDPVHGVRAALKEVASGDLAAAVVVDDTGEVGELQRGFNEMVAGLRERERLADLFGRHVGPDVAQRALAEGAALGGEVRAVSALFVDIVGSTAMARERPASDVVAMLNDFFDAVISCVGAEGGWVNKFEGDGAVCVFGAPVEQEDHPARALRAARRLVAELRARGHDAGIGVSSGEAVAGNVGAEQRFEYTVIGSPVNEAARLSDAAKQRPQRVLASKAAVAAAGSEASAWIDAGTMSLRGLAPDFAVCEPRS